MIQIQDGKYYRTRSGNIVGPVSVDPTHPLWKVRDQYHDVWTEHGHFIRPGIPHGCDLIEEVSADPDFFIQAIQRIDKLEAAIDRMQEAIDRLKQTTTKARTKLLNPLQPGDVIKKDDVFKFGNTYTKTCLTGLQYDPTKHAKHFRYTTPPTT